MPKKKYFGKLGAHLRKLSLDLAFQVCYVSSHVRQVAPHALEHGGNPDHLVFGVNDQMFLDDIDGLLYPLPGLLHSLQELAGGKEALPGLFCLGDLVYGFLQSRQGERPRELPVSACGLFTGGVYVLCSDNDEAPQSMSALHVLRMYLNP